MLDGKQGRDSGRQFSFIGYPCRITEALEFPPRAEIEGNSQGRIKICKLELL
jgi:hypothetical protein